MSLICSAVIGEYDPKRFVLNVTSKCFSDQFYELLLHPLSTKSTLSELKNLFVIFECFFLKLEHFHFMFFQFVTSNSTKRTKPNTV